MNQFELIMLALHNFTANNLLPVLIVSFAVLLPVGMAIILRLNRWQDERRATRLEPLIRQRGHKNG